MTETDFENAGDEEPPFFVPTQDEFVQAHFATTIGFGYSKSLPPELKPPQTFQHPTLQESGSGGRQGQHAGRGGRNNGSLPENITTPHDTPPTTEARVNSQFNQKLKDYWASLTDAQQSTALNTVLRQASSSMTDILGKTGLSSDQCGRFHLKGRCPGRFCNKKHTPQAISNDQAKKALKVFKKGFTALANNPNAGE